MTLLILALPTCGVITDPALEPTRRHPAYGP